MTNRSSNTTYPILVDFGFEPGLEETSGLEITVERQQALADQAMQTAMSTIRGVAAHVRSLHETLPSEFEKIEVEFGVKLSVEAGALLAKTGGGAHLNVTLVWKRRLANNDAPPT